VSSEQVASSSEEPIGIFSQLFSSVTVKKWSLDPHEMGDIDATT